MLCSSCEFLPNEFGECLELCGRQIALLVLGIEIKHVDRLACRIPIVDEPNSSSFAATRCSPTEFPQAAPALYDGALGGPKQQCQLEGTVRVIVKMSPDGSSKHWSLDKLHVTWYANGVQLRKRCAPRSGVGTLGMQHETPTGRVRLTRNRGQRVAAGHLWVYAGEIEDVSGEPGPGDLVDVYSYARRFCGRGFFNPHSKIRVRLLTFKDEPIDEGFWERRLQNAAALRRRVVSDTNAYRLVHGESDLLPGLLVDCY